MTLEVSLSFNWASEMPHMSNRFFSSGSKLFTWWTKREKFKTLPEMKWWQVFILKFTPNYEALCQVTSSQWSPLQLSVHHHPHDVALAILSLSFDFITFNLELWGSPPQDVKGGEAKLKGDRNRLVLLTQTSLLTGWFRWLLSANITFY